jgi:hypothetical protein
VIGGVLVTQRCNLFAWSAGLSGLLFYPIFFPTRMLSGCSCSCRWGRQFGGFLEGIRIGFAAVLSGFLLLALVMGLPFSLSSTALSSLSLSSPVPIPQRLVLDFGIKAKPFYR